ncbi:hypothetical protein C8R47DRAFT_37769 [Mycena vitilis]|nr:hypothetical protein C8R47DRAFT_37769 [Mycena vitilis]
MSLILLILLPGGFRRACRRPERAPRRGAAQALLVPNHSESLWKRRWFWHNSYKAPFLHSVDRYQRRNRCCGRSILAWGALGSLWAQIASFRVCRDTWIRLPPTHIKDCLKRCPVIGCAAPELCYCMITCGLCLPWYTCHTRARSDTHLVKLSQQNNTAESRDTPWAACAKRESKLDSSKQKAKRKYSIYVRYRYVVVVVWVVDDRYVTGGKDRDDAEGGWIRQCPGGYANAKV